MNMLFHYKYLTLILAITSFFGNCSAEKNKNANTPFGTRDSVKISKLTLNDNAPIPNAIPLKNMFGINAYEWNFLQDPAKLNQHHTIYEDNMAIIKSFSAVRHYMNWNKLENTKGNYTYSPT